MQNNPIDEAIRRAKEEGYKRIGATYRALMESKPQEHVSDEELSVLIAAFGDLEMALGPLGSRFALATREVVETIKLAQGIIGLRSVGRGALTEKE